MSLFPCLTKKPLTEQQKLNELKARFRSAYLDYRDATDSYPGGGGLHIIAVINPAIGLKAKRVNELAAELKAIDPQFPQSWAPFPTGDKA